MRILNISKKSAVIFILALTFGCGQKPAAKDPAEYIKDSDAYYAQAAALYKKLISQTKAPSKLYLELGRLYFSRGEYDAAIGAFNHSAETDARKFLALSFYRQGDFTGALEIFNKGDIPDDEFRYYFGLTCARLNLFDQALKAYRQIQGAEFKPRAKLRIEEIERSSGLVDIKKEDPQIARLLRKAPPSKLYPQAGALVLLADESIEVTAQNTQESVLHYLVKILNERGKEDYAETAVEYDSTFEKIELVYARTIKPDGRVVYVGSRHIRDVSQYLNFPLYSNARVFIISFPEVAIGSALEYKIKIKRSQLVNKKDFFLNYPVQSGDPVISADFRITLPKGRDLRIKTINEEYNDFGADLKADVEEKGGNLIYRWQFKNIPQIIPEPGMPAEVEINPTLLLSTFTGWQEVDCWWRRLAYDKIKADRSIKDAVKRLTRGKFSALEKARAIYNFCAKEIRYVAVEYGQAGYEPHAAADIFRNKYGDCKDQAVLLVTMLKEAGLNAAPVLIPTKSCYNLLPDFPSALFNHCIAALYLKDKAIFLDPTAETCAFQDLPPADQGRRVLVFKKDGYSLEEIPPYPGGHNLLRQELELKVSADESIAGEKVNITFGAYDQRQRYWLLYTQPELIQDALKGTIQGISIGAKLDKYAIDNLSDLNTPVVLSYSFHGPEYFTEAGPLRIMPQLSSIDTSLTAKEKRRYPIDLGLLDQKESYLEIAIPRDFTLKYLPDNIKVESPWLSFSQEYSFAPGKVCLRQFNCGRKDKVTREEYAGFKSFMENLARAAKQRIVLERLK